MTLPNDIGAFIVQGVIALAAIVTVWVLVTRSTRDRFAKVYDKLALDKEKLELEVKALNKDLTEVRLQLAERVRARELEGVREKLEAYIDKRLGQHEAAEELTRQSIRADISKLERIIITNGGTR